MKAISQIVENLQQQALPASDLDQATGLEVCEFCRGSGMYEPQSGKGYLPCPCQAKGSLEHKLIAARVPPRYRSFRLSTLTPDASRSSEQAKALADLRANPWREKFFITGAKKGAGKSLFGWCLLINALEAGLPVYGIETDLLLQQLHRATVNREAPRPWLLPEDLMIERKQKDLPTGCLLLDEAEKANFTEFNARQVFQILQQAVNWCWQVVIISNVGANDLQTAWQQAGNNIGEAIARRALEDHFAVNL